MNNHLKTITNIIFTSIGLSVILGSLLRIVGPIYQKNQSNRTLTSANKSKRFQNRESIQMNKYLLNFSFNENKIDRNFIRIEKLITNWEAHIKESNGLEASCFFLSLDNKTYAEIKSKDKLSAASSIKVPILIVLLKMLDSGEISWDEKLILSKEVIGSGSGWMAYQKIGEEFPIFEVATEMIRVSDNTATNLLIKRLGGIDELNKSFNKLGLRNTRIKSYLPDLDGTNLTSTMDLTLIMALVDNGYLLSNRSRDIFREIMSKSKTNTLIPAGILSGLGKETDDIDYHLSTKGYVIYNKTGDIGISYSDTALIQTPYNSRAFATFIVQGPFNDPRSAELIRKLSAELIEFLDPNQNARNTK